MRLVKINLLALALVLLSVGVASAITIRLENTADPNQVQVFLDMDADAGTLVQAINIGVDTLDSELTYLGATPPPPLSIGATGILLSFSPFAFLAPTPAYGQASISQSVPAGSTRALVDYFSATATNGSASGTQGVLMGTLDYDGPVFAEYFDLQFGTDGGFFITDGGPAFEINAQINLVNNLASVPEPTTAMLVGLGLVGLGVAGRRKA